MTIRELSAQEVMTVKGGGGVAVILGPVGIMVKDSFMNSTPDSLWYCSATQRVDSFSEFWCP